MKTIAVLMTMLLSVSIFASEQRGSDRICFKTKANEGRFAGKSLEQEEKKSVLIKESKGNVLRK